MAIRTASSAHSQEEGSGTAQFTKIAPQTTRTGAKTSSIASQRAERFWPLGSFGTGISENLPRKDQNDSPKQNHLQPFGFAANAPINELDHKPEPKGAYGGIGNAVAGGSIGCHAGTLASALKPRNLRIQSNCTSAPKHSANGLSY